MFGLNAALRLLNVKGCCSVKESHNFEPTCLKKKKEEKHFDRLAAF